MKKLLRILETIIFTGVIILCIYVFCASDNEQTQITSDSNVITENQFTLYTEDSVNNITLPYSISGEKDKGFLLSFTLPDTIKEGYCLTFRSLYCINEVYVNDTLIGTYGKKAPLPFGHMTGNIRVIVPLTPEMSGQALSLVVIPYYNMSMDLSSVEIGDTNEIKWEILNDNLFRLIVCVVLITILFLATAVLCYQKISHNYSQINLVKNFICFDFLVTAWIICSSDIPQFITDCNEGVSLISFMSLTMICIPFVGMCESIIPKRKKIFRILGNIGWILPSANIICFVCNICDPMDLLVFTHIYLCACIITSFIISIIEWNSGVSSKFLLIGMIEITVFAGIGLSLWYVAPSKGYDATLFGIGFILFISTLFALIEYLQIKLIEEKKYMDTYKKMAYMDSLTMIKNRTAFEEKFAQMQKDDYRDKIVTLIMFDLNNLKKTNDTYGHQEGDKLIVGAAQIISNCFNSIGDCYRLGGDEFAVILVDIKEDINRLVSDFKRALKKYGIDNELNLSCSVGFAQLKWNPGDTFFRDIYKIADREMYKDKIESCHGEKEKI